MATSHGLTLAEVLGTEVLAGTVVLAGAAGLGRPVGGVNVMETPDVAAWTSPDDLLVTTGYPLLETISSATDHAVFTALVRDLHARGLAGLGIKLGRFVSEVPPAALAVADELGFPLLGLAPGLAFDDLLRDTYARLHELQAAVLRRIDRLHAALTFLVLEGGDLRQIVEQVAEVLDVAVAITSTDGREQAATFDDGLRARLLEAGLVDASGRFRVERVNRRPVAFGDGEVRLLRVSAGGTDLARMVCVSQHQPVSPDDVYALERAATVAALFLTRQQAVSVVEGKYRGDFLRDVFLGRAGDADYVASHARGLGWELDRPVVVVCAEIDPPAPGEEPVSGRVRRRWQERFAAAWRQVTESADRTIATVDFSAEVVTVLPVPAGAAGEGPTSGVDPVVSRIVSAVAGDKGGGRRPFSVGVSRPVDGIAGLPQAYAQARRTAEVGRRVRGGGSTTYFDQLGVHRLIALVPDPGELTAFAAEVLGDLAHDTTEAADLRTTLQVLLDCNLNVAEAARTQFFHYNTMRYRIGKLERLIGPFTSDPHLRLNVAVALQVVHMTP